MKKRIEPIGLNGQPNLCTQTTHHYHSEAEWYSTETLREFAEEMGGYIRNLIVLDDSQWDGPSIENTLFLLPRSMPFAPIVTDVIDVWGPPVGDERFFDWLPITHRGRNVLNKSEQDTIELRYSSSERDSKFIGYFNLMEGAIYSTNWVVESEIARHIFDETELFWNEKKKYGDITIGCDPEFEIWTGDGLREAVDFLRNPSTRREIGIDGAGSQLELRPAYSSSPEMVIENIQDLLHDYSDDYVSDVSVEGNQFPLGGHIHIGVGEQAVAPQSLLEMLDDFLTTPTWSLNGGARGGYRGHSQWRKKPYGFEFRSLPAGVFATPELAEIVLKVARNIVDIYIETERDIEYEMLEKPYPTINKMPRIKDYEKVAGLTNEEARSLVKLIVSYNQGKLNHFNILANWIGGDNQRSWFPRFICFYDDWSGTIRREFREFLRGECGLLDMQKEIEGMEIDEIQLFGLQRERGSHTTTLPEKYLSNDCPLALATIEFPISRYDGHTLDNRLIVGLPRAFRREIGFYDKYKEDVGEAIVKLFKEVNGVI